MEATIEFSLRIDCTRARPFRDQFGHMKGLDISLWESVAENYRSVSYNVFGSNVEVTADWTPIVRRLKRLHKNDQKYGVDTLSYDKISVKTIEEWAKNSPSYKVTIKGALSCTKVGPGYFQRSLLHYLYDLFLLTNLSVPGSCTFSRNQVVKLSSKDVRDINIPILSNDIFNSYYLSSEQETEISNAVPFVDVLTWYRRIPDKIGGLPESNLEKVLFSLFYMVNYDGDNYLTRPIWIFYAIETLFDAQIGNNINILGHRISLLLSLNNKEQKKITKAIRSLYKIRSSLVHGGFQITHPLDLFRIDSNEVDDQYYKVTESCDRVFSILVQCIQKMITNDWIDLSFPESLSGH